MPIYEYKCNGCGRIIERFELMSNCSAPTDCVVCGDKADRIISIPSLTGCEPRCGHTKRNWNPEKANDPKTGAAYNVDYDQHILQKPWYEMKIHKNPEVKGTLAWWQKHRNKYGRPKRERKKIFA